MRFFIACSCKRLIPDTASFSRDSTGFQSGLCLVSSDFVMSCVLVYLIWLSSLLTETMPPEMSASEAALNANKARNLLC